ncbi:MAG: CPBP family intramembrane metalloprotease, partial [Chloroflexi bacterium]|nr:CPBP family intramembrane metalloprotease [Chloroflexota bacterium]
AERAVGSHRLAIGAVLCVLILNGLLTLPIAPFLHLESGLTTSTFVIAAGATQIPMLLIVWLRLVRPGVMTWADLGLRGRPLDYVVAYGFGAGIFGLIVIQLVGTALTQVGLRPNQLEQFNFVLKEGPASFALLLLSAGIAAPFAEELFFRGFLFGTYRRTKPLWMAYGASSLMFTLLHLEPNRMNPAQMAGLSVGIFILATLLAWVYERTDSLYPGMLAHALNNATGLILFYTIGMR